MPIAHFRSSRSPRQAGVAVLPSMSIPAAANPHFSPTFCYGRRSARRGGPYSLTPLRRSYDYACSGIVRWGCAALSGWGCAPNPRQALAGAPRPAPGMPRRAGRGCRSIRLDALATNAGEKCGVNRFAAGASGAPVQPGAGGTAGSGLPSGRTNCTAPLGSAVIRNPCVVTDLTFPRERRARFWESPARWACRSAAATGFQSPT